MKLKEAMRKNRIGKKEFVTFSHGETRIIHADGKVQMESQKKILL